MRRWVAAALALGALGGCNFFGDSADPPTGFAGWFHKDVPGRATNLGFGTYNLASVRDLGCDQVPAGGDTTWAQDGDALVLPQWGNPPPRFTQSTDGGLLGSPGIYGPSEEWFAGATCLICPPGDAGVAVACAAPAVLDGGS